MEPNPNAPTSSEPLILLITGSCCMPQMAVLDQQAERIIQQALEETGTPAQVRTVGASSVFNGGIPAEVIQALGAASHPSNLRRLPAVLINNRLISFGIPKLADLKQALSTLQNTQGNTR